MRSEVGRAQARAGTNDGLERFRVAIDPRGLMPVDERDRRARELRAAFYKREALRRRGWKRHA